MPISAKWFMKSVQNLQTLKVGSMIDKHFHSVRLVVDFRLNCCHFSGPILSSVLICDG